MAREGSDELGLPLLNTLRSIAAGLRWIVVNATGEASFNRDLPLVLFNDTQEMSLLINF